MRISQINCVYGEGSTGKLVRDLHLSLLQNGYESQVLYGRNNPDIHDPYVYGIAGKWLSYLSAILRRVFGMQFDWAFIQTYRIIRQLKCKRPDIVHLHCINGNNINIYILLHYLAKHKIKTLYTLHSEYPYTGGCGHAYDCERWKTGCGQCPILKSATQSMWIDGTHRTWEKQNKAYEQFNDLQLVFTAVSPWLKHRAEESPMLQRFRKVVVLNGIDTSIFHLYDGLDLRRRMQIGENEKMVSFVTASFNPDEYDLKGGRFVVELAKRLPFVKFVVAANYGQANNLPNNLLFIGRISSQEELARLYSESDLTIITSRRETFSMPVAESLCCGTPVVGFKAGGPESISISPYSCFVEYANIEELLDAITKFLSISFNKVNISQTSQKIYSKKRMVEGYIELYQNI